jgi:hypothetical protein
MKKTFLMLVVMLFSILIFSGPSHGQVTIDQFNLKANKLVGAPWDANVKLFRLMVAPWGKDDSPSYGFSWQRPFKTITGALNWLPTDMKSYECNILIHGGRYINGMQPSHRFHNGRVNLMWVGTYANTGSGIWNTWIRAGSTTPILNDSAIVVCDTLLTGNSVVELNNDQDFSGFVWSFRGYDYDNSTAFDNKWVFDGRYGTHDYLFTIHPGNFGLTDLTFGDCGIAKFYLGNITTIGINLIDWGPMRHVTLNKIKIIGGSGAASTGNGLYGSGMSVDASKGSLTMSTSTIYGVTSVWLVGTFPFTTYDIHTLTLDSGSKVNLHLYGEYQGVVSYADETFTLVDASTLNHSLRRYHSSALADIISYITPNYSLSNTKFRYNNIDTTRTFDAVTDSVKIKVNLNGQDYWLKLTR